MTFDDVKTRLTDIIGNPDNAQEKAVTFLKDLEQDYTSLSSMTGQVSEQEKKIQELRDTNQRLFLSVTGQDTNDSDKTEENPIDWDSITKTEE